VIVRSRPRRLPKPGCLLIWNAGGEFVQVCTFSVAGWYAGTSLRADPSPVITGSSDVPPLFVSGAMHHNPVKTP
jgi:hypothetical protein